MAFICPLPPTVTSATTDCTLCGGEIGVYLLSRPVDWENTPGGLLVHFEADHRIGPHACRAEVIRT